MAESKQMESPGLKAMEESPETDKWLWKVGH